MRGERDDRGQRIAAAKEARVQLETVLARQLDVEQDQLRPLGTHGLHQALAAQKAGDRVARDLEHHAEQLHAVGVVFDDQDLRHAATVVEARGGVKRKALRLSLRSATRP